MPPPLTISGGRFNGLLGRGGTAEVSRWSPDHTSRDLACKYPLTNNPDDLALFRKLAEREWELIGGWKFPGIVRLVSHGQQYEYLLMELCEGSSLDSAGQLPYSKALAILSSIAAALSAIHARGIIHCDIKPQNIFLPTDWDTVSATQKLFYSRLSDFSLGRKITEPETARAGIGTIGYSAPETVRDNITSIQSDLFSLGVVTWQMFAGRHPFIKNEQDSDPVAISSRVTEEHPAPLSQLLPDCHEQLSDLVTSLLAKSPQDRPSSCWEVCQILESIGSTYPIQKAIRPRHLADSSENIDSLVERLVAAEGDRERLKNISCNNADTLVSILDENHRTGLILFDGSAFFTNAPVIWPSHLRRQVLKQFSQRTLTEKKHAITKAVSFGGDLAAVKDTAVSSPTAESLLLIHLLSNKTVQRVSQKIAKSAQISGDHTVSSRLFVQAGALSDALTEAQIAVTDMKANHNHQRALSLLQSVTRYADIAGQMFSARNLLMLTGDILKQTGQADSARVIYDQIVALYEGHPPDNLLAKCYKDIGDLCKIKQTIQEGIEALNRALEIYQTLNNELEISHTLNNLGNIYWVKLDLLQAAHHYRRALRIQRRLKIPADIASTLNNLGSSQVMQGRFRRAITLYDGSLKIARDTDNQGEIARTLNNLGYTYHIMGQPSQAVQMLRESLDINRRIGSQKEVLFNIENLTQVMIGAGQLTSSLPLLDEGSSLAAQLGDTPHRGTFVLNRGLVAKRLGDFGTASECFSEVEEICSSIDSATLNLSLFIARAGLRFVLGDTDGAKAFAMTALALAVEVNDQPSRLNALIHLARIADDENIAADGLSLAQELGLSREKRLLNAWRLEKLLSRDTACDDLAAQVLSDVDSFRDDLERPAVLCVLANWFLKSNKCEESDSFAKLALESSVEYALLPEQAKSLHILGQGASVRGDYEFAYHSFRQALAICRQLSESINDDNDKSIYLNQTWIQGLFTEIRQLAGVLGQKKGQVVA
jgi:serine/threonine protein kinase/tetratricopeptide (TPR) repeat protein